MADQASARRMRLLEDLRKDGGGKDLGEYAQQLGVDERTVRRDVDYLQDIVGAVQRIELRRGKVIASRGGYGPGYFTDQLEHNRGEKQMIARAVVDSLPDNLAIALTAGSTTYEVARELRRAHIQEERPRNLIAFTNSLPVLLELIAADISTGLLGEVYNVDDCAFHAHEFHSAFHASVAVVGASGVVANPVAGTLDLCSHRAEEAAFLKQLLRPITEIIVAADASKLGRRHPWSFTSDRILAGKTVRLYTSALTAEQRDTLDQLTTSAPRVGCAFEYHEVNNGA